MRSTYPRIRTSLAKTLTRCGMWDVGHVRIALEDFRMGFRMARSRGSTSPGPRQERGARARRGRRHSHWPPCFAAGGACGERLDRIGEPCCDQRNVNAFWHPHWQAQGLPSRSPRSRPSVSSRPPLPRYRPLLLCRSKTRKSHFTSRCMWHWRVSAFVVVDLACLERKALVRRANAEGRDSPCSAVLRARPRRPGARPPRARGQRPRSVIPFLPASQRVRSLSSSLSPRVGCTPSMLPRSFGRTRRGWTACWRCGMAALTNVCCLRTRVDSWPNPSFLGRRLQTWAPGQRFWLGAGSSRSRSGSLEIGFSPETSSTARPEAGAQGPSAGAWARAWAAAPPRRLGA